MVCGACVVIPLAFIGISISLTDQYYVGLLIFILSLCIYLHYKEFKKCDECITQ